MTVPAQTQPYTVSTEQKHAYQDRGFILIEDFYTPEEHASLAQYTQDLQNWGEAKGKWMQYYEKNTATGEKQLCRTENFTPFHEPLREYVRSKRLMDVFKELHGEDYVLFKEKVNYKLPGGGGKLKVPLYGFPPHQDAPAFVQFGQSSHMTVMFTIDPTTAENGCLEVVPGSHKNSYNRRILPQEKHDGSISREWCNEQNWIPVFCKPGSVLIFGAYLAHRSGDNNTEKSRVAVYLTYNAAREGDKRDHYYDEKRRLFPPASDREEGKNYDEGAVIYNLATPITD